MFRPLFLALGAMLFLSPAVQAKNLLIGDEAPEIQAKTTTGKNFDLKKHRGSFVVLEWTNPKCPFVRKHYDTGNMQKLQQYASNNEIFWVSINSGAKGQEGHQTPDEANRKAEADLAHAAARILDESGQLGRAYGAKTTPHLFIVDKEGKIAYNGAVDSIPTPDPLDIERAEPFVYDAITEIVNGDPIQFPISKPYGCSVKYAPAG